MNKDQQEQYRTKAASLRSVEEEVNALTQRLAERTDWRNRLRMEVATLKELVGAAGVAAAEATTSSEDDAD
ncbi:hypothetical protein [Sphingomonas sp.]|jgi:uncharacterized protein YlxW (UPF0749 family)|uniref:hypothetical protein n=1 Tax=Sphingomonas sp. TaxID=28214 RepID=UPI003564DD21